jgi:hypothetical protein
MPTPRRRGDSDPARTELCQRVLVTCEHYVYRKVVDEYRAVADANGKLAENNSAIRRTLRWLDRQGLIMNQIKERVLTPRPVVRTGAGERVLAAWREAFGRDAEQ